MRRMMMIVLATMATGCSDIGEDDLHEARSEGYYIAMVEVSDASGDVTSASHSLQDALSEAKETLGEDAFTECCEALDDASGEVYGAASNLAETIE